MVKPKDSSEVEYLRGINRQLTRQIKNLKKQVGRGTKEIKRLAEGLEPDLEDEIEQPVLHTVENPDTCPQCTKEIVIIDLGKRLLHNCKACGYRKVKIK